ncbi:MAG TPA: HEAT repeat domain-containing protein [Gaiellaceae bacterium]|jgi:HEAT repeat protein
MVVILAWVSGALAAAGFASVLLLVVRRVLLARAARNQSAAEEHLRPVALALAHGEQEVPDTTLSIADAQTLAGILARYAVWLSGDSRAAIASFFERHGIDEEIAALETGRAWQRAAAAFALGDMGSTVAVAPLLAALSDGAREVRSAAARSLGRLQAPEAVEPLVLSLADGQIPRAVVGQALLGIGHAALPALRVLETNAEPRVRATAVELIGLLGDPSDGRLLVERLSDSSAEVRSAAARALGRLGAAEGVEALRRTLGDRIPFVRVAAATALGLIRDKGAVDELLELVRSDHHDVARAAAEALARIDPARVRAAGSLHGAAPHLLEAADLLEMRA